MFKLILLAVAVAFVLGVVAYEDGAFVVDTQKAETIVEKSKTIVNEHIKIK